MKPRERIRRLKKSTSTTSREMKVELANLMTDLVSKEISPYEARPILKEISVKIRNVGSGLTMVQRPTELEVLE